MKIRCLLFASLLLFFASNNRAMAQQPNPASPNGCVDPPGVFSRWTRVGANPVGPPVRTYEDLVRLLAPADEQQKSFTKPWQQLAASWGISQDDFFAMWNAALQGEGSNWQRIAVEPCTVFDDMVLANPPRLLHTKDVYDPIDKQPARGWAWQVNERIKFFVIEGCSNPTYQLSPVRIKQAPAPQLPPSQPATILSCPQCPEPQVNVAAPQITNNHPVEVKNEHPITNNHPVTVVNTPQKVEVTFKGVGLSKGERFLQGLFWATGSYYHIRQPQETALLRKEIRGLRQEFKVLGPAGPSGLQGSQGVKGDPCSPNDLACRGPQGDKGDRGDPGAKGDQGDTGVQGPAGPTGAQGPVGPAGSPGSQGQAGQQGPQGPSGSQGQQGSPGAPGATGAQGPQGPTGSPGSTGANGSQGPSGPQGPPGKDGQCFINAELKPCGIPAPTP